MIKEVKKLYNGCIDIRDYEVKKATANNENIKVRFGGDTMTLSPEDLITKRTAVSKLMKNKINNGKDYHLYSYEWRPDDVNY